MAAAGSGLMSMEAYRALLDEQARGFRRMLMWSAITVTLLALVIPAYRRGLAGACATAALLEAGLAVSGYSSWRRADLCARAEIMAAHTLAAKAAFVRRR